MKKVKKSPSKKESFTGKTIVIGVLGADPHGIANKLIEFALNDEGFRVVNLGIMTSQQEFIEAAIEAKADALFVSSINGHGEIDARDFRENCREMGLDNILIYIGGNLVVGRQDWIEVETKFKTMGFDRVYPPGNTLQQGIADLKKDLGTRAKRTQR